jgi:hypothetical protein
MHCGQFVALFRTRPRMRAWTGVSSCIRGLVRRNGGAAAGDSSVKRCASWVSANILSMYAPPHCCRHRWLHRPLGIHFMCSNARPGHGRLQDRLPRRGRSSRRWLCGEQSDSGRAEEAQRVGEARPGAATMGRRNYQPLRVRRPQESAIRRQEIDHRRLCEERLPTPELEIKRSERSNQIPDRAPPCLNKLRERSEHRPQRRAVLRRRERRRSSPSASDDEVGGFQARSARSERSERSNQHCDQRENRLPETVVTKFLIESGKSLRCQFSGP